MYYSGMVLHIIRPVSYSLSLSYVMMLYHLVFAEVYLMESVCGLCDG